MKRSSLILCAMVFLVPIVFGQNKVNVTLYYESFCGDSMKFIKTQLGPNYPDFEEFINIEFVTFGKSKSIPWGEFPLNIGFMCQHGVDECAGNKIQTCGCHFAKTQASTVEFVKCKMGHGIDNTEECAKKAGLPYESIMECYSSELGTRLQTEVEEKTKQLAAPRDIIPSVPTVVYNNKFDQEKRDRSITQFRTVLCEEIKSVSNEWPSVC